MANAPSHGTNAATKMVIIYNKEGETFTVSRLNALDLVRESGYFWKLEDINKPRPEDEGPANPKAKTQVVYNSDGEAFELDTANARDMVSSGKYFWNDPTGATQSKALDDVIDAANALAAAEKKAADALDEAESLADVNPIEESLVEQALRVTGKADVAAYLGGFTAERLRDMAYERYGEKIHHRSSLDTIITRIVALEDMKNVGDDQAEA